MLKSLMKKSMRGWTVLLMMAAGVFGFANPAPAVLTRQWEFESTTNYTYDSSLIEVVGGVARLKLIARVGSYSTYDDYTATNSVHARMHMGPPAVLQLASNDTGYASHGVFTSRVLDGGAQNQWRGFDATVTNAAMLNNEGTELNPSSIPGLVSLWHMNNNLLDEMGLNNGSVIGDLAYTPAALFGAAATRMGTANGWMLLLNTTNAFNINNKMTISMWVNFEGVDSSGNVYALFDGLSGPSSAYTPRVNIYKSTSGSAAWNAQALVVVLGTRTVTVTTPVGSFSEANDGKRWRHLVFVLDGDASSVRIYKDGALIGDAAAAVNSINAMTRMGFGYNFLDGAVPQWKGLMDEVALFNRALAPSEIRLLYEMSRSTKFQIRSGDAPESMGEFVGPDNTTNHYFPVAPLMVPTNGIFNQTHRYVQYRAYLRPSSNQLVTPSVSRVMLTGTKDIAGDYTYGDFSRGTFDLDTVASVTQTNEAFLGLARRANGGFFTNGVYLSRIYDAGQEVNWNQISWQTAVHGVAPTNPGVVHFFPLERSWADVVAGATIAEVGMQYTTRAKQGTGSAVFNGQNSRVTFGSSLGKIQALEFWLKAEAPNGGLFAMNPGSPVTIALRNGCLDVAQFPAPAQVYLNGSRYGRKPLPGWNHVVITTPNSNGLTITSMTVGVDGGSYFKGAMDDVAMYNRFMPENEAINHFKAGHREIAGLPRFQVRGGASGTNLLANAFVGPDDTSTTYFSDPANSQLANIPARFFQYRAALDGDGDATPGIASVSVLHGTEGLPMFVDQVSTNFMDGTFQDEQTAWYGETLTPHEMGYGGVSDCAADPALKMAWHMEELAGTLLLADASGFNNSGALAGSANVENDAAAGLRCIGLDGRSGYVRASRVDVGAGDFSAGLWFKSTATNRAALMTSYSGTGFSYYTLELNGNGDGVTVTTGTVAFVVNDNASGMRVAVSPLSSLNDGTWHHVMGVRRGQHIYLAVDGERVASAALGAGYGEVAGDGLMIGKYGPDAVYCAGAFDEAVIYVRALTDGEIRGLAGVGIRVGDAHPYTGSVFDAGVPMVWGRLSWGGEYAGGPLAADTEGLVALWHLDGDATDAGLLGLNGAVAGASFVTNGVFSNALNCAGAGGVDVPDNNALEPTNLTVEAWVYPSVDGQQAIIEKRSGSDGYALFMDDASRPVFWFAGISCTDALPLPVNMWSHLAGVFDGTSMRLYVNGEVRAVAWPVGGAVVGTLAPLRMGRPSGSGNAFAGRIDEVALHRRALSTEEIADRYRAWAVKVKVQVRTAETLPMSDPFIGPDGTTNTVFINPAGSEMPRSALKTRRYFQWSATFETRDARCAPVVKGLRMNIMNYSSFNPTIEPVFGYGFDIPNKLLSFDDLRTYDSNNYTQVKYQLTASTNFPGTWYYWDVVQGKWAAVDPFGPDQYAVQSSPKATIIDNIDSFYDAVSPKASGLFRFKAFLHSPGDLPLEVDWVRATAIEGRIVVEVPNGAEVGNNAWISGAPYAIRWSHAGNVAGTVKIEYTLDNGGRWDYVTNGIPASLDSFPWTTPDAVSSQVKVRITHETNPQIFDESDAPFELVKRFRVVQPNGGSNQVWYVGETNTIVWDSPRGLADVNIDFSRDGSWAGIASPTSTSPIEIVHFLHAPDGTRSNTYAWVIPTANPWFATLTAKVRVQSTGGLNSDDSDDFFAMAGAGFVSPHEGEKVRRDSTYPIRWNSALCGPTVTIELQSSPTDPWTVLATNYPNVDGLNTFNWVVAGTPSDTARMRLHSDSNPRARGLSQTFTIAAIDLISPNGHPDPAQAEVWMSRSTQTVSWISYGASPLVNLKYSVDSGATWSDILDNVQNPNATTNHFTWVIPPTPTPHTRVRVEDAGASNELWTISRYDFHIAGIAILWPNGPVSQEWLKGDPRSVTWLANEVGAGCYVEFSYDGGVSWTNIVPGGGKLTLSDGLSSLYVPTRPTVRGGVRIRTADLTVPISDTNDAYFTVAGVLFEKPLGGDQFTIGTTNQIRFVVAGTHALPGTAKLLYSSDGVSYTEEPPIRPPFSPIEDYPGENTYNWNVEWTRKPSLVSRVMVQAGLYSEPSEAFTLKGIRVEEPAAGALVSPGVTRVRWSFAGIPLGSFLDVYLSGDGVAGTMTKINPSDVELYAGEWLWTVTENIDPGTNAVLKLVVKNGPDAGLAVYSRPFNLKGIKVLQPGTNDVFSLGASETIQWRAAAVGSKVDIFYSSDNGATFDSDAIALAIPSADGNNTFNWVVEKTRKPSTQARVKIVANDASQRISDPFTMNGIKFLKPTSRTVYSTGESTNNITWAAQGADGPYQLEYSTDGGGAWTAFPGSVAAGARQYNWASIPLAAVGSNVVLRISGNGQTNVSESFQIVSVQSIFVVTPKGGAFWKIGQTYPIEWSRGGEMENDFTVWYLHSYDGFATSNLIANAGSITYDDADEVYRTTWTVPDRPGQARIVVKHNVSAQIQTTSPQFNIVGSYTVFLPNGGEKFYAKRPTTVGWRTVGSIPYVDVFYSATPPYRGNSWIKVNTSPIPNNNSGDLVAQSTEWSWDVANIPWSDEVKFRVQEAGYDAYKFDAGQEGPYDDSDNPFTVRYYRIYWEVYDKDSNRDLDKLSVMDSSGWAASGLATSNTIYHDYPYGVWITEWSREFYSDYVVLNWSPENPALGSPDSWTQKVYMTQSPLGQDYQVLANFAYDYANKRFKVYAWLERHGNIVLDASDCQIYVYDENGLMSGDISANPVVISDPGPNGVFSSSWDASTMSSHTVYFAKVEIKSSVKTYSSGVTFSLQVLDMAGVVQAAESNIVDRITGVSNAVHGISSQYDNLSRDIGGLSNLFTGTVIRDLTNAVADMVSVVGPITNILSTLSNVGGEVSSSLARILNRPDRVEQKSILDVLFKTASGFGATTLNVQSLDGSFSTTVTMTEVVGGIYQASVPVTTAWPLGSYRAECSDPAGNRDGMVFDVVAPGVLSGSSVTSALTNQLDMIEHSITAMTNIQWTTYYQLTNDMSVVFNRLAMLQTNLNSISTNGLEVSPELSRQIASLTNGMTSLQSTMNTLTNLQSAGTNLQGVVTNLQGVGADLKGLAGVDWTALQNIGQVDLSPLGTLATRLGQSSDSADQATVFGRLASLSSGMAAVGASSTKAARNAQSAKTQAMNAADGVQQLLDMLKKGDLEGAKRAIDGIQGSLNEAQQSINDLPKTVSAAGIFEDMRAMAKSIQELAQSKGWKPLLNLQAPGEGGAAGGAPIPGVLSGNLEELKSSLAFMQKLMDEKLHEPIVEETLIGGQ